ncbi:hypothetical protein AAG570_013307 [Ranatra chinensis]|uniref:Uncharacterized protein n=1 Tax=Ranatra chinensis TaxID=642074 RepID=A0ABD0YID9_9HEMI
MVQQSTSKNKYHPQRRKKYVEYSHWKHDGKGREKQIAIADIVVLAEDISYEVRTVWVQLALLEGTGIGDRAADRLRYHRHHAKIYCATYNYPKIVSYYRKGPCPPLDRLNASPTVVWLGYQLKTRPVFNGEGHSRSRVLAIGVGYHWPIPKRNQFLQAGAMCCG